MSHLWQEAQGDYMNARAKGLQWVREVKKLLEGMGHVVEGPGYSVAFYQGRMNAIHRDYFGIADLISYHQGIFYLHQITDLHNKSSHVKTIQASGLPCWLWCRVKGSLDHKIFFLRNGKIEEGEIKFK